MTATFRRLPNGILHRVVTPEMREAEARKAYEKSAEAKAARKAERLAEKREADIIAPDYIPAYLREPEEYKNAERIGELVAREMKTVGEAYDIIDREATEIRREGVKVAAVRILVMYRLEGEYALDHGLEEGESVEDTVRFIVYRDPAKPRTLRIESTC